MPYQVGIQWNDGGKVQRGWLSVVCPYRRQRICPEKYTAGGARLESRRMGADGKVTTMAYEGNEVIENGKLRMLMFDGGYVDFSVDEPRYCWYTKDHLGGVRAVADAERNVFASYDYGPYSYNLTGKRQANRYGLPV